MNKKHNQVIDDIAEFMLNKNQISLTSFVMIMTAREKPGIVLL